MAGNGWFCVAELDADPERLDELLGAFSDRVETAKPKAATSLLGKRFSSLIPFPATVTWMRFRRVPVMHPGTT